MEFSVTGKEKGDLLIQVTVWAGITVCLIFNDYFLEIHWKLIMLHFFIDYDKENIVLAIIMLFLFLLAL